MKVAYVGDFINHGKSLQTYGTSLVILLSKMATVDTVDVFCPELGQKIEEFSPPSKVKVIEFYRYDDPLSLVRLFKVQWNIYDSVIFNLLPTGFGNSSISNATGLMIPILLSRVFKKKNIKVIYHNSVFTNDVSKLGYNTNLDRIRAFFLAMVEKVLFRNVNTFVLFNLYKQRIDSAVGRNKVSILDSRYLEAVSTVYMNNAMDTDLKVSRSAETPLILMHGVWGPQKNIETGLSAMRHLKEQGIMFKLIISGGTNHHFPEYEIKFNQLLSTYSDVITDYTGPVDEKNIMKLFLETDVLILPYNTPGGHSGVLEQAIFFEVPTIAIDFPEYREQANGCPNVRLVTPEFIPTAVLDVLNSRKNSPVLNIKVNISKIQKNQEVLIS